MKIGKRRNSTKDVQVDGTLGVTVVGKESALDIFKERVLKDFTELKEIPSGERYTWSEQLKGKKVYLEKESLLNHPKLWLGAFLEEMCGVAEVVVLYSGNDMSILKSLCDRDGVLILTTGLTKEQGKFLSSQNIWKKEEAKKYLEFIKVKPTKKRKPVWVRLDTIDKQVVDQALI